MSNHDHPSVPQHPDQNVSTSLTVVQATPEQATLEDLAAEQRMALDSLCSVKTMAQAARSAGISRTTLYRWFKGDVKFQAAYNQWHEQMRESGRSRLLIILAKALGAIERSIDKGDGRLAVHIVKGLGLLNGRDPGPTNAAELAILAKSQERKLKRMELLDAELEGIMQERPNQMVLDKVGMLLKLLGS